MKDSPPGFATVRLSPRSRTPLEILSHIADLLDWSLSLAEGKHEWHDARPSDWQKEVERFFNTLSVLDNRLAADTPLGCSAEKLFQGPIADALIHVGQIAMLRRIAGSPVRGENYFMAEIVAGRIGPGQAKAKVEFD